MADANEAGVPARVEMFSANGERSLYNPTQAIVTISR